MRPAMNARHLLPLPAHRIRPGRASEPGSEGVWLLGICFRSPRAAPAPDVHRSLGVRGYDSLA